MPRRETVVKKRSTERVFITKSVVDAAKPFDKSDRFIWDSHSGPRKQGVIGFGLRVRPSGHRTFVLQYRIHGKPKRLTVCLLGDLTVQEAREKARRTKELIADGIDPLLKKRELRERRRVDSVSDLCDEYISEYLQLIENNAGKLVPQDEENPVKRSWRDDLQRIEDYVKPTLGHLPITEVRKAHVGKLYRKLRINHGYLANRVLALIRKMFNLAIDWEHLPADFHNPAKIKSGLFQEVPRTKPVKSDEWPRILKAIDEYKANPKNGSKSNIELLTGRMRALFRLIALTGLRSSEIRERKWEDVDIGEASLRLSKTKSGKNRLVPLSEQVIEEIQNLKKNYRIVGSPYLFPSPTAPLSSPVSRSWAFRQWVRIREAANCPDLRPHDLRHSLATWMDEKGYAPQDIQKALGHASIMTTLRYMHGGRKTARTALSDYGADISSLEGTR